jgi:hypothetical protein
MESEERELIPWSSLVAETDRGFDRRWLVAAALVGFVLVAGVVLSLRDRGQPAPATGAVATTTTSSMAAIEPSPAMVVTEEELTARTVDVHGSDEVPVVAARAEWFTMDWFTVDGSAETQRSLRAALADDLVASSLPHDDPGPQTFVEWARTVHVDHIDEDAYEVIVLFRTIHASDSGFERDPVRAVSFSVSTSEGRVAVARMPTPVDVDSAMAVALP